MAYIGREPQIGNFQICDAISTVNNQAAYTMQVATVDVSPESANHMIVSLNGVIQKPTDAYTVSGSTITFAANLVTGDVIDFIQILGNVLDLGVPSDGTVTSAKITYPLTTFSSTGIDDNATSTAITIDSSENVGIGTASPVSLGANITTLEITGGSTIRQGGIYLSNSDKSVKSYIYGSDTATTLATESNIPLTFSTNNTERMRIDTSGNLLVGTTDTSLYNNTSGSGWFAEPLGSQQTASASRACADWNRMGNDGSILGIYQAGTEEGSISVSGSTVSYNGFTGTHWSRFTDNSTPTILRGTVLETLDEMCYWYNLEFDNKKIPHVLLDGQSDGDVITYNYEGTDVQATIVKEVDVKHMMSKVSDTTDAKNVYGLFIAYDLDGEGYNDFYVASVGSYVVRIKSGETIAKGDLLQSNGDGTAKVQSDDNIKSSSFAKVLSTTVIETYEDGSYLVPCSLMC
jgi:hypothetical protein